MDVHSSVSSWCVPLAISARACASISSAVGSGALSSSGSGGVGCLLLWRLRFALAFAGLVVVGGGLPKPICCGGALDRLVSTLDRAFSARKLMLFMISSRRD